VAIRRAKFDWSSITRYELVNYFWSLSPKITNIPLSTTKFHSILRNHIQKSFPIKIKKLKDSKVNTDLVWIGGTYYSELDKTKKNSIELVIVYNTLDKINIPARRYHRTCISLANTVMHELIHMRQYRRRKFKVLPDYASNADKTEQREEQSYLGNSDEIDAYSYNIACELMDKFKYDTVKVINYLNEDQKKMQRKHNSWRMYLKAFNHDHEHVIIKRVKKKVVRYLPYAISGKPYKNKDWISN